MAFGTLGQRQRVKRALFNVGLRAPSGEGIAVQDREEAFRTRLHGVRDGAENRLRLRDGIIRTGEQAEGAFAQTYCRIERIAKAGISRVGFDPRDGNAGRSPTASCLFDHAGRNVDAGDLVSTSGQLDRVAPGPTPDIQHGVSGGEAKLVYQEIDFGHGILGETVLFVLRRVPVEEIGPLRSGPLPHMHPFLWNRQ
jgi:hypothetical protein